MRLIIRPGLSALFGVGMALLTLTAEPLDAFEANASNRVISMGSLSSSQGWVLTDRRLLLSDDDGASWRDDAFIAPSGSRLLTAQFLDPMRGWVVISGSDGIDVVRTSDAGLKWDHSSVFSLSGAEEPSGASLSFVNEKTGYLMLRLPSGSNSSRGALFRTDDGGFTWRLMPTPPIGDQIRFFSEQNGWLSGGPSGSDLFVTRDGGRSWKAQSVTPPTRFPQARLVYLLPAFDNDREGLLPVRVELPDASTITLYETHDGGGSWALVESVAYSIPGTRPLDLRDHTLFTTDRGGVILTLRREGGVGKVRRENPSGLPAGFDFSLLSFADSRRGWVTAESEQCAGFKVDCWHETRVLRTRDGGASFADVTPELLLSANRQAADGARHSGLHSSELNLIGTGTQIQQNRDGFDTACYPSVSTMQNWWTNSPYYYVSAYIGGSHAYCFNHGTTCPCVSASWLSQAASQGWTYIPVWVGPQEYFGDLSTNTTTAFNQGVNEANQAADRMAVLSFPQGSIVYFDFERPHPASIEPSVKAFVNGWSSQLHARGLNAGVYGSYLSAAAWQGTGVPNAPDAIWPYNLNVGRTVFDLCGPSYCLPNDIWSNHQRVHQYSQNMSDTHGGITLTIDQDFADGPTAIYGSTTTTCTSFSIGSTGANPGASSGSQSVTVTGSPSGCQGGSWSASGNGSWLTVSPTSGLGSGSTTVSWTQNTSTSARSSSATIAGNSFNVTQAGSTPPTCTSFFISPTGTNPSANSGSQLVTVTGSPSGCQGGSWSASGNGSWLTVSPTSGSGSGSATVSWTQNTSTSARSSSAAIAGNSFNVTQAGSTPLTCTSFFISPTGANPSTNSGSQFVTVTGSPSGCQGGSWSASSNGSWLTVSPTSGSGSGSATVSWTQNTSTSARSSSATIAGNSFNVTQAGSTSPTCTSFFISPAGVNPSAGTGSQFVTVTGSPSGCQGGSWSASGNGSWLTVSPTGGSGSGSLTVAWTQNASTSSRSASATIAGNSFNVNQSGSTVSSSILLVDDDDDNPDVRSYYIAALAALGRPYDLWNTANSDNEPGAVALQAYQTVIWLSGASFGGFAGPGASGEADLATFLSGGSGRCMILSSQDYYFDRGTTSFMTNYLGLGSASNDVGQSTVQGQGSAFSGLGPYTLSYPFTDFSDRISPAAGAELAFSGNNGDAAISRIGPNHRTIFLGFPLEALPTTQARQDVMAAGLDFCSTIFADVPPKYWARKFVEAIFRAGVTNGCADSPRRYCPEDVVTRGSMAQLLLAAKEGPNYVPPACTTSPFSDVPASSPICPWVQELARRGVTAGCGSGQYCPGSPVTRAQMAVFLLSTSHGPGYAPAPCTTSPFTDVPSTSSFCPWIQEMVNRGITAGCGGGSFCTGSPNTRAQLAVFLVTTFGIPLQ